MRVVTENEYIYHTFPRFKNRPRALPLWRSPPSSGVHQRTCPPSSAMHTAHPSPCIMQSSASDDACTPLQFLKPASTFGIQHSANPDDAFTNADTAKQVVFDANCTKSRNPRQDSYADNSPRCWCRCAKVARS